MFSLTIGSKLHFYCTAIYIEVIIPQVITTLLSHFNPIANRLFLDTGKTHRQHQHRHEVPKDPMGVKGKTPIAFGGGEVLGTGFVPWILMDVIMAMESSCGIGTCWVEGVFLL